MSLATPTRTAGAMRLVRSGRLTPSDALELDHLLEPLSMAVRPRLVVDLSDAEEIHPAVVSVLRRHQRRARRQGGELHVVAPLVDEARHGFELVGLCTLRPTPAVTR